MKIKLMWKNVCPCWLLLSLRLVSVAILTTIFIVLLVGVVKKSSKGSCWLRESFEDPPIATTTSQKEYPNLKVLTKDEFTERVNVSDFFSYLSDEDLKARSTEEYIFQSADQYKSFYINSYEDITEEEINKLLNAVKQADVLTAKYKNLQGLEWKIVKVNSLVEYGMPHTLVDMIVLSKNTLAKSEGELVNTLIHEKIHIYQRKNASSARKWVESVGFSNVSSQEFNFINKEELELRRSNPDLDKVTYKHNQTSLVLKQLYNSRSPTSLKDSKAVGLSMTGSHSPVTLTNELLGLPTNVYCQLEHPFEMMACLISEIITSPSFAQSNSNNNYVTSSMAWMLQELA